jgi:hypothetical protein
MTMTLILKSAQRVSQGGGHFSLSEGMHCSKRMILKKHMAFRMLLGMRTILGRV